MPHLFEYDRFVHVISQQLASMSLSYFMNGSRHYVVFSSGFLDIVIERSLCGCFAFFIKIYSPLGFIIIILSGIF